MPTSNRNQSPVPMLVKTIQIAVLSAVLSFPAQARADWIGFVEACAADVARRQANAAADADRIREAAGIPETEVVGVETGQPVGYAGGTLEPVLEPPTVLSESDAASASSSGDGTFENPYTIRNVRFVGDGSRQDGFVWDDPNGKYFIRLADCELSGYPGRQVAQNTMGGLFVEGCTVAGSPGSVGIHIMGGDLYVYSTEFSALDENAVVLTADDAKIHIANSRFSDRLGMWGADASALVIDGQDADVSIIHSETSGLLSAFVRLRKNAKQLSIRNVSTDGQLFVAGADDASRTLRFEIQNSRARDCPGECIGVRGVSNFDIGYSEFLNSADGFRLVNLREGPNNGSVHHSIFDNLTPPPVRAGNENLEAWFSRNVEFADNWSKRAPEDAFEFVAPQGNSTIRHSVGDNTYLQVFDVYGSSNGGLGATVHHVYGDSANDVGVLVTDANNVLVHDVFTSNTTGKWNNVTLEQRNAAPGTAPNGLRAYAPLPLPSDSYRGNVFGTIRVVGENNEALWFDESGLRTYGTPDVAEVLASRVCSRISYDGDLDSIPDAYEITFGLDPENGGDAFFDPDRDHMSNFLESLMGTSPISTDTDGDGSSDRQDAQPLDARTAISSVPAVEMPLDMEPGTNPQVVIDYRGGSDGLTHGNVQCGMPGVMETACEFVGKAYIEGNALPELREGSISLWFNPTEYRGPLLTLDGVGTSSDEQHVVMRLTDLGFEFAPSAFCSVLGSTQSADTFVGWHHVLGTWGPGGLILYVDGQSVASAPCTRALSIHDRFLLGDFMDDDAGQRSLVDEFRVHSVALGPYDVWAECGLGRSDCGPAPVPLRSGTGSTGLVFLLLLTTLVGIRHLH